MFQKLCNNCDKWIIYRVLQCKLQNNYIELLKFEQNLCTSDYLL